MHLPRYVLIFLLFLAETLPSQNDYSKWYFGTYAGLDFMTSPPTVLTNSSMDALEGCASIADDNGNLLFYTDGDTVWNKSHVKMANGTGLFGDSSPSQSALIVKKPGSSTLYYIFTMQGVGGPAGFNYSIVDISLASGQGSVTAKNVPLFTSPNCSEKVSGTAHCNGRDVWIVMHNRVAGSFRAYLLTPAGVNPTVVVSTVGPANVSFYGYMKFSPMGDKLAFTGGQSKNSAYLFDFDNATGNVSNPIDLQQNKIGFYGCEFSPDGSKLYQTEQPGVSPTIHQWDVCAGSAPAIIASHYTILTNPGSVIQQATDGKIYVIFNNKPGVAVINDPNASGPACNYMPNVLSLNPGAANFGLPNFVARYKKAAMAPFISSLTPSLGCHAVSFTASPTPTVGCAAANNYSVNQVSWNFGDPGSGAENVSTGKNAIHIYSSSGTFTAMLIFHYRCTSDTVKQVIVVPPPDVFVKISPGTCGGPGSATVSIAGGSGPYSYTWSPSAQNSSVAANLSAGAYSVSVFDQGLSCRTGTFFSVSTTAPAVFSIVPGNTVAVCRGNNATFAATGNPDTYVLYPSAAGSGSVFTIASVLAPQVYTVLGFANSCSAAVNVSVSLLPGVVPLLLASKNAVCLNDSLRLEGSGGIACSWSGPAGFYSDKPQVTLTIGTPAQSGVYTLTVTNTFGCKSTSTTVIAVNNLPGGSLDYKTEGCAPLCTRYTFSASENATVSWQMNDLPVDMRSLLCLDQPGLYRLSANLDNPVSGCRNKLSYQVTVHPKPVANFVSAPEQPVENLEEVQFVNTSEGEAQKTWYWYFMKDENYTKSKHASYWFKDAGNYAVALVTENAWGCSDTVVRAIRIEEDFFVYVPNAFTPNGDGLNEVFIPVMRSVRLYELAVYDRWGERIFYTEQPGEGWDGTFKGEPCKSDTYTWLILATSEKGETKRLNGRVTLNR